jgi:phospho-N-acetylmuramoyl-pentapeptide-transferase
MWIHVGAFLLALALALLLCRFFRRSFLWFRSRERKEGKERIHRFFPKPKRPLGGGVAMLSAVTVVVLACGHFAPAGWIHTALPLLLVVWAFGLIGLADDLRKMRGLGLGERQKFGLQILAAAGYAVYLRLSGHGAVNLPFATEPVNFGWLYVPFAVIVLTGAANAVNLTDGMDGLAAGSVALATFAYWLVSGVLFDPTTQLLAAILLGAVLGFLAYNWPPARLLMGDTGALGLGAALAALALVSRTEWLLLIIGGVFVVDTVSVILQVSAIRFFRRVVTLLRHQTTEIFRPFLCTPLHHHFQWLGWSERTILALFLCLGGLLAMFGVLALLWPPAWIIGLILIAAFLAGAALQKLARGSFFLGFQPDESAVNHLALFVGLPIRIGRRRLYDLSRTTELTESMIRGLAAESLLWRSLTEIEAGVILGRLYADHRMTDQALAEWSAIPPRNLLLREGAALELGKLYYGRDRLLDAILLWDRLPRARLEQMPNLREAMRAAKVRLADLAMRSHRQSLSQYHRVMGVGGSPAGRPWADLHERLRSARRYNEELLSLLLHERGYSSERGGRPGENGADGPTGADLYRRLSRRVLQRITELDDALKEVAAGARAGTAGEAVTSGDGEAVDRLSRDLGLAPEEMLQVVAGAGRGRPRIVRARASAKASRNAIVRLWLEWDPGDAPDDGGRSRGPATLILKRYQEDRIAFFSACYRRERGVLDLLSQYGVPAPRAYGGLLRDHDALLLLEDVGEETLAQRLEANDAAGREHWLRLAIERLAELHARARDHLPELSAEIRKVDKETLNESYYWNTFRIALGRLLAAADLGLAEGEWEIVRLQFEPVAALLAGLAETFIHFEYTPHHLLLSDECLTAFDFEQATLGPLEFDLAALLRCPESELPPEAAARLLGHYATRTRELGQPALAPTSDRALDYASFFKGLFYAGAAANFHRKFGGEFHLQRLGWYLRDLEEILSRHPPLGPLRRLLAPHLGAVGRAAARLRRGPT